MIAVLLLLSQDAATAATADHGVSKEIVAVIAAAVVTIIGSLTAAVVSIITTVRTTNKKVAASAVEAQVRGKSQDRQLRKIHLLTNSRLAAALKLLARMTKKEADRTKDPEDIAAYEEARRELEAAEVGTIAVEIEEEAEKGEDAASKKDEAEAVQKRNDA